MKFLETIQNLADSINNLASSIRSYSSSISNKTQSSSNATFSKQYTSPYTNTYTNTKTYAEVAYTTPPNFVTILKSEHEIIGRLYRALTSDDPQKNKNDQVLLELKTRWPKLYTSLIDIITAKTFGIYKGFSDEQK